MIVIIFVASVLLVSTHSQHLREVSDLDLHQWELFKVEYLKSYDSEKEEIERRNVFLDNLSFVRDHNVKYQKGKVTFEVEMNKFADMTIEEFATKMNGVKRPAKWVSSGEVFQESTTNKKLPHTVDWRKKGAVTSVKDQGHCSSCWAFSATGSLEGHNFIKTRQLESLSEQNLLDCSKAEGNQGCHGGLMDQAFRYIKDNDGIDTEPSYPYEARDDTCRYVAENRGASVWGHVDIPSEDEDKLQVAVALKGPVSAAIDSSYRSFQFYKRGVYNEERCSSDDVDHGVLVVGYGNVTRGGDYWLVKNSWGTDWGMQGYIMMARNLWNMCGIATMASFPTV